MEKVLDVLKFGQTTVFHLLENKLIPLLKEFVAVFVCVSVLKESYTWNSSYKLVGITTEIMNC